MRMYWSECGEYVLVAEGGVHDGTVYLKDGSRMWIHDRRVKTWDDAKIPRKALPFCIGGYSCQKTGEKKGTFTINLLECDTEKFIEAWTGNTVIRSLNVKFRRKIPSNHHSAWRRKLGIT